jgi:ArsR family transcriptional regulator
MEEALQQQGGLDRLRGVIPSKESLTPEAKVFNALSDPIRLQILHALKVIDLCPCLLKDITELSDSKLSYHLNILETAGLIASSPRKRWRIYMLTEQGRSLIKA